MSYELSQCIAPLPPVERGKSVIIGGDPKGKNFLYCSGKGIMMVITRHMQVNFINLILVGQLILLLWDKSNRKCFVMV